MNIIVQKSSIDVDMTDNNLLLPDKTHDRRDNDARTGVAR